MKKPLFYLPLLGWLICSSCNSNPHAQNQNQKQGSDSVGKNTIVGIRHQFKSFPVGQALNFVPCIQNSAQTYCLYLPKNYDTSKSWAAIYFFDAHARGKLPVNKYKALADKYQVILIGSNNSQNGMQPEAYERIASTLFHATQTVLNISPTKIITAGFSGGGKVAAGIALKNSAVASVISCGAGMEMDHLGSSYFNYITVVGKGDFNYWDMIATDQQLNNTPLKHLLLTFNGIHEWPDVETMSEAINFAINPSNNTKTNAIDASLEKKENELRNSYTKAFQTEDAIFWLDEINKLNSGYDHGKTEDERWMNRRLLSFINMMTYMRLSDMLNNKQLDAARPYLNVFKASDPKNPDGPYLTADWYALRGDNQDAFSSLSEALKLGYDDFAHFSGDRMLANMQNENGYKYIYKKLSN